MGKSGPHGDGAHDWDIDMTARRNASKAPASPSTTDGGTDTATLAPVPTDDATTANTAPTTDALVSATDGPTDDMTLDPADGPALGDDVTPATTPDDGIPTVGDFNKIDTALVGGIYGRADASNKAKMRKCYTDATGDDA